MIIILKVYWYLSFMKQNYYYLFDHFIYIKPDRSSSSEFR